MTFAAYSFTAIIYVRCSWLFGVALLYYVGNELCIIHLGDIFKQVWVPTYFENINCALRVLGTFDHIICFVTFASR